ncbi:7922_t:CDS:10, partial [Funneliformis geosporum]
AENDNFTCNRRKEHALYKKALDVLAVNLNNAQAQDLLSGFKTYVTAITQPDAYVPTGCSQAMNEKSSEGVINFWAMIEKKYNEERIEKERQRHVTDIQHRDLVDIFQSCGDRQDEPNQSTYLRKRKEVDYNEDRMSKRVYHDGDITPSPCSLTDNSLFETPQHLPSASNKSNNNEPDDFTSGEEVEEVIDDWINYYFDNLEKQVKIESKVQWKVGEINVTKKFRQFQNDLLYDIKHGIKKLTWHDTFDLLALSSIIVLDWPCPYNTFTADEWLEITDNNPFKLTEPVLNADLTTLLHDATFKKSLGLITDFIGINDNSKRSHLAKQIFYGLADDVPIVAPRKTSEDEHRFRYLDPFLKIFGGPYKNYKLRLNRTVNGSQKRPDFSCVVDDVPILNSEVKPIGYTELQRDKDYVKVNFRAKKTINTLIKNGGVPDQTIFFINMGNTVESFIMDLEFEGIYRSWPFLKTNLITDRQTLPLLAQTLSHFIALEERVNNLAGDYKCRTRSSKPTKKDNFIRDLPDSPQLKKLLK